MPVFRERVQYGYLAILVMILAVLFSGCAGHAPVTSPIQKDTPSTALPATVYTGGPHETLPITSSRTLVVNNTPAPTATPDPGFETKGSLDKLYYYIIDGTPGYIPLKVYTGVNSYIASSGDIYTGDDYNAVIGNEVQRKYVSPMVENIRRTAKKPDDEARIAISLVQHIKYDAHAVNEIRVNTSKTGQKYVGRYPYTILDQNWGGICGEKSFLLALLLKELGYGVALYEFDDIHHIALGIKAPTQYAYQGTGYALIESTAPEIPTFDEYSFVGINTTLLSTSPSKTVIVSDGKSFTTIKTEYSDAQLERSIYQELGKVSAAATAVNAAAEQLDQLRAAAEYWGNQAQNDYTRGYMAGYQNDLSMFNQAKDAYENYYNQVYHPAYIAWSNLKDEYQNNFAPKQEGLEDKYGMTTGIGVGL
jgi:hypothetical protein